ncbi:MAG: hypothetical protein K2J82_04285 [Muribaculaceae bacterium]|nr:hypothetical protein [Muribaculaceae bacterium]MDE6753815.1 hypothetical protein [Muribaculaceae bacterium]
MKEVRQNRVIRQSAKIGNKIKGTKGWLVEMAEILAIKVDGKVKGSNEDKSILFLTR